MRSARPSRCRVPVHAGAGVSCRGAGVSCCAAGPDLPRQPRPRGVVVCDVMHPGPMNRGVEIDPSVADGPQSVITEQVEMGVAVRMAVLDALVANKANA